MDEQELKRRIPNNHQEHVSMMLNWVGIEEVRAAYLGDYRNVLPELADPSADDWPLVRADLIHIAHSDNLHSVHNRWFGQEISTRFETDALDHLHYLTLDTRRDRPDPRLHLQERYPVQHQITPRAATYYCSRTALAVLVRRDDPHRAIELLEDVESIFEPRVRYYDPGKGSGFSLEREMDRAGPRSPVVLNSSTLVPSGLGRAGRGILTDESIRRDKIDTEWHFLDE